MAYMHCNVTGGSKTHGLIWTHIACSYTIGKAIPSAWFTVILCRVVNSLEAERQEAQKEEEEQTEAEAAEGIYIDEKRKYSNACTQD